MATITGTGDYIAPGVYKIAWQGLGNGDDGNAADGVRGSDKTVQVFGTFGSGGQVDIEGSNDDGTTWHVLNDAQGDALNISAESTVLVQENPQLIRPNVSNGDGTTDLDVHLIERQTR